MPLVSRSSAAHSISQNQLNDRKKSQAAADTDASASATYHAEATSLVRSSGRLSIREAKAAANAEAASKTAEELSAAAAAATKAEGKAKAAADADEFQSNGVIRMRKRLLTSSSPRASPLRRDR